VEELPIRQTIPLKSSQFGIKIFTFYESNSYYLWSFIVYTGNETVLESPLISEDMPKTTATFPKLSDPLLYKGYSGWIIIIILQVW
jgi:hypothetical protein